MYVHVKVRTKQKEEKIIQNSEFRYKIDVKEDAVRNQANTRVIQILQGYFKSKRVKLISGHHVPTKLFSIDRD